MSRSSLAHIATYVCTDLVRVAFLVFPEGGHDSFEDAAAALELMRWKVMEDKKVGKRRGSRSSV